MKKCSIWPQQDGILVLNKPSGPSSAACIAPIKRHLGQKKIGHAGTLDPMASGVLIVLLGQATKLSGHLMAAGKKIYAGTLRLGETTDTWDSTGEVVARRDASGVSREMLAASVASWIGETRQEVPPYSAAKHQGKPLYAMARKGLETPVKTKTVLISHAEIEWVDLPLCRFRVACASGTYIRSLAHSLGIRLGCGAALTELTREYSHPFGLADAVGLDELLAEPQAFPARVIPLEKALPDWAVIRLRRDQAEKVRNGMRISSEDDAPLPQDFAPGLKALMLDETGKALALMEGMLHAGKPCWSIMRGLWN